MAKFTKSDLKMIRKTYPKMARWSDRKVLRVANRMQRRHEKNLRKVHSAAVKLKNSLEKKKK